MHSAEWHEKKEIAEYLASIGAWHFKPTTMGFGGSGVPDIIFCYRSKFGAIEVKREGKEPTKLQQKRMLEIQAAGGEAFWGTADKVIPEIKAWTVRIATAYLGRV